MPEPRFHNALEVRPVRDNDVAAVIALWELCGLTRPWNDPARDIAFARRGDHSDVLAGFIDGRLVASVLVGQDGHRGTIYYFSVLPELQGQGYGRELMAVIEKWMRAQGVWKINLLVREDNPDVIKVYGSLGFTDDGTKQLGRWLEPKLGA